MPTVLTMLSRAMRLCGALQTGEVPTAEEAADGLAVFNTMLDQWNTQQLYIYAITRSVFAHLASTASYALGPGATWNTGTGVPRPPKIDTALYQDTAQDPDLEWPMHLYTDQEYQGIVLKGLQTEWPWGLHYNPTVPNGTVTFYPVPRLNGNTVLYYWQLFSAQSSTAANVTLATGYQEALEYNLARRLAHEYGKPLMPDTIAMAVESLARIKTLNHRTPLMSTDIPSGYGRGDFRAYDEVLAGGY